MVEDGHLGYFWADSDFEQIAGPVTGEADHGCFDDQQFWVLYSLSGKDPGEFIFSGEELPPRDVDDLAVLFHLGPETCLEPGLFSIPLGSPASV